MIGTIRRATLLALYQLTVAVGILLLPLVLLTRQAGVVVPVGRLVDRVGAAYADATRSCAD